MPTVDSITADLTKSFWNNLAKIQAQTLDSVPYTWLQKNEGKPFKNLLPPLAPGNVRQIGDNVSLYMLTTLHRVREAMLVAYDARRDNLRLPYGRASDAQVAADALYAQVKSKWQNSGDWVWQGKSPAHYAHVDGWPRYDDAGMCASPTQICGPLAITYVGDWSPPYSVLIRDAALNAARGVMLDHRLPQLQAAIKSTLKALGLQLKNDFDAQKRAQEAAALDPSTLPVGQTTFDPSGGPTREQTPMPPGLPRFELPKQTEPGGRPPPKGTLPIRIPGFDVLDKEGGGTKDLGVDEGSSGGAILVATLGVSLVVGLVWWAVTQEQR